MNILYIDNRLDGHHLEYLKSLSCSLNHKSYLILPQYVDFLPKKRQYLFKCDIEKKNPLGYVKLIAYIKKIAHKEEIDVIHFLSFNPLLKYFGILLGELKNYKIIATFHHYYYGTLRDLARKLIYQKCTYGVVHTNWLLNYSYKKGIYNCVQIEYPVFKDICSTDKQKAKSFWGIPNDNTKVFLALGGTRFEKGLDLLLNALNKIDNNFYLLIAGKEEDFNAEFVRKSVSRYKENVFCKLAYLTDEEVQMAISASDIIVLPYRRVFDGASGPLTEGVLYGKCVIGPSHGSLVNIIRKHHLGYIFRTEDVKSLSKVLTKSLKQNFQVDDIYRNYQKELEPSHFVKKYEELYTKAMKC